MSLAVLVLRLATVFALRDETLARDRVLDSPLDPLSDAMDVGGPVIAVFAGGSTSTVDGRDLTGAETTAELVIQVFLPAGVTVETGGRALSLTGRGSGAEVALNVIERQIKRTLMASDKPWSEIWRRFALAIEAAEAQPFVLRTGEGSGATRATAREITLTVETLCDPPIGQPLPDLWKEVFALMRAAPEVAPLADWLEAEASPSTLPEWRAAQAALGLTNSGGKALGLGPEHVGP